MNTRITTAKSFAEAAAISIEAAIKPLEEIIAQKEEQRLARETLNRPASGS